MYIHIWLKTFVHTTTQVKRKHRRTPEAKLLKSKFHNSCNYSHHSTIDLIQTLDNDIASRQLLKKINMEWKISDRLTVAKLNNVSKPNKQD